MQGAVAFDGEAGHPAVDQRDGARLERPAVGGDPLVNAYLGVGEVGHYRLDVADDDQYRQSQHRAKVGVGDPHRGKGTRGRHEDPRGTACRELARHLGGVGGVGGGQHRGGEHVVLRRAHGDAGVGQVGVDLEVAVAGVLGGAAGGGDAGAHQGDHQVADGIGGTGFRRRDDLGHRHRPRRLPHPDPRRRGQPEPAVSGVVQGPRMHRGVDRVIMAAGVIVHQAEAAAHHGVADLADRQRTGHRARPAQPHQEVGAGELVDVGAAVHPVDAVPQRQRLGVAQHLPDGAAHHDPLTQGAAVALHRGRRG